MKRRRQSRDFREFVFTATGPETDLNDLSMIEVADNLLAESERLHVLETLLGSYTDTEIGSCTGLARLLGDIRRRTEVILDLAVRKNKSKSRASV